VQGYACGLAMPVVFMVNAAGSGARDGESSARHNRIHVHGVAALRCRHHSAARPVAPQLGH